MKFSFTHLLLLCALALSIPSLTSAADPSMVIEVFRHGARGPIYGNNDVWGSYVGQLTPVGMRMHYLLGAALKDRYPSLLTTYDPAKIIVRSTNYNRTIMSAYCQLYGIYGGTGPGLAGNNADALSVPPYVDYDASIINSLKKAAALPNNHQVLPLHVDSLDNDKLLRGSEGCPPSYNWSLDILKDEETAAIFKNDLANITEKLKAKGLKIETLEELAGYGDAAIADKFQNVALPGDVVLGSQEYKDLKFATEWWFFKAYNSGRNEAALHSLNLFLGIKDYIHAKLTGTSDINFAFLSGHDDTLAPVLVAFNITTKECLLDNYRNQKAGKEIQYPSCIYPGYASNLVFEVYAGKTVDEAEIKFYYNNVAQPICGKTGENSNTCTFKEFGEFIAKVTKGYTVSDYNKKCEIKTGVKPVIMVSSYDSLNVKLGVLCVALLVGLVVTCVKIGKRDGYLKMSEAERRSLLSSQL